MLPGEGRTARDHGAVGVFREVREGNDGDRRGFERPLYRGGVPGLDDAGVGDEQGAAEPQFACERPDPIRRVPPEDRPRPDLEIERDHREVNSIIRTTGPVAAAAPVFPYADCRFRSGHPPDTDPMADLRHCRNRVRLRHLRNPDAAADRAAGIARADRRRARLARIPDVGGAALLHPRLRRRHLRLARRLHDRSVRPPPGADLQHPHLRAGGLLLRVRDLDRDAALPALPGVHRRLRRVRRGRGVAGRALPRTEAAREGARLHAGVLVARRPDGGNSQQLLRRTCGGTAGARCVRLGRHPESPRAVALHADVRRHPGHPADPHPAVPAGIAGLAAAQRGGHAAPPEHRRAVRAGAASHDDRHDGDVRNGVRCGVRRHSADPADRARPAGSQGDGRQSAAAAGTADRAGSRGFRDQVPGDRRPGRTGRAGVARGRDRQPAQADSACSRYPV